MGKGDGITHILGDRADRGRSFLGVRGDHRLHLLLLSPLCSRDEGQESRRHPAALQIAEALLP